MSDRTDTERLDWFDRRLMPQRLKLNIGLRPEVPRFVIVVYGDAPRIRWSIDAAMDAEAKVVPFHPEPPPDEVA